MCDALSQIPRPDQKSESLGLTVLDEPCAKQSDPTVLDLQLRAVSKQSTMKQVVGDVVFSQGERMKYKLLCSQKAQGPRALFVVTVCEERGGSGDEHASNRQLDHESQRTASKQTTTQRSLYKVSHTKKPPTA